MDWGFIIFVLASEFEKLGLEELKIAWGGEMLPYEPRQYRFLSSVRCQHFLIPASISNRLGHFINLDAYTALSISGEVFEDLQMRVNSSDPEKNYWAGRSEIIRLIQKMYSELSTFVLIKERDEEEIDREYLISNADEAIEIFIKSLKWASREGIVNAKQ